MEVIMEFYEERIDNLFECALSNLFDNEQTADTLVSFLKNFQKYGNKEEKEAIKGFIEGINFYKERKIFFGEDYSLYNK